MRISEWFSFEVCVNCHSRLSLPEQYYSNSTCPYCGVSDGEHTICVTRKVTAREIKHYVWWQLFNRRKTYEGKDDFSKQWLEKRKLTTATSWMKG